MRDDRRIGVPGFLLIATALLLFAANPAAAGDADVQIGTGSFYGPGDELTLSIGATIGDTPVTGDVYVAIALPDGGSLLFLVPQPGGGLGLVPGEPFNPSTWGKFLSGVTLPAGTDTGLLPLLKYTFGQGEPGGTYTVIVALVEPGTTSPIALATRDFTVLSRPLFGGRDCSQLEDGAYDGTGGCGVNLVNLKISAEGFPIFQNFEDNGNTTFGPPGPQQAMVEIRFSSVRNDLRIFGIPGHQCFLECTSNTSFILDCESTGGGQCTETFRKR